MNDSFVLKTVNEDGEVIKESTIEVNKGSILIQRVPSNLPLSTMANMHRLVSDALSNGSKIITIPDVVTLSVLEIKDQ
jgi:hypothetical protein